MTCVCYTNLDEAVITWPDADLNADRVRKLDCVVKEMAQRLGRSTSIRVNRGCCYICLKPDLLRGAPSLILNSKLSDYLRDIEIGIANLQKISPSSVYEARGKQSKGSLS